MIDKSISHYQILEKLGEGGMGVVYKARDTHLDRFVALKILPADKVADTDRRLRFIQEAKAASSLNHPHIVTIHDIDEADGVHFIAMEYVDGKTLDQLIPRHGMRLNEALKVAVQMADALAVAHEAGIIHRDLKPGNLMVTEKGQVKVLDFGLAKLTEKIPTGAEDATRTEKPDTEEGKILGTVAYMSPEQAEGKKVDARSDIFSFGSVLYEMLSGKRAFEADSKASTQGAIIHKEPAPLGGRIPHDLEKAITRCLRKNADRRFQHMADLKVALEELKDESDSGALESAGAPGAAVHGKLWWTGVLAGLAVIFAALGIAGWFWFSRSHLTPAEAPLSSVPLTSYRGRESSPSFSLDGTQVAFQWCQEEQKCHIYIKQVGVEPPFQLTHAAVDDFSPAWSPDGQSIAFIRELEPKRWALMSIPQRGGQERQLETWDVSKRSDLPMGPYLAWTPDSKWLAFPWMEAGQRNEALFLISTETGEKRRLTTPPDDGTGDTSPAFSPDGGMLAFSRDRVSHMDLYLLRLGEGYKPQGEARKVETAGLFNLGIAWTTAGREIIFSSGNGSIQGLWRLDVTKPGEPVRVSFAADNAWTPSISRARKLLACSVRRYDSNIWRVDLEGPGRKTGNPVLFISSTKFEYEPAYSPDGRRIAFVSWQSGAGEIWTCDSDGRNSVQLTALRSEIWGGPRWSADGKNMAFGADINGNMDIYVVNAGGGAPRRFTTHPRQDNFPFWSRDGRWLYFGSDRSGQQEIWKMPSEGGEAVQVTRTKGRADVPQESPDGKFLYYAGGNPSNLSIWRVPVEGGEEAKVLESVHPQAGWAVKQEGIYFFIPPDDKGSSDLCLLEFSGGKTQKIFRIDRRPIGKPEVSPDGRTILYSQLDDFGSDLMLVENFR